MDNQLRYGVEIIFENEEKQIFHLEIGAKSQKSTLMETDHPYTLYFLPEELTSNLIDLMEEL